MKKRYTTPEIYLDSFENTVSLLASSADLSATSSIEGFTDDGDVINW